MCILTMEAWSPYLVGIGIGVLSWFAFLLSDKAIGCSTAFARTTGMIERFLMGNKSSEKEYYKKFPAIIDWEWMLVLGIMLGSFISAVLSGSFSFTFIPHFWSQMIGDGISLRFITALYGGIFMGLGARWAGGCTSGHGISGTMQMAVSSWFAAICIFVSGIICAHILF